MSHWNIRTELLLGKEKLELLKNAHVLVVGLGGVGAAALEFICRAGVGTITLVDGDSVEASNRNRQLGALLSTDGQNKAEVWAKRLKDINPEVNLIVKNVFFDEHTMPQLLTEARFDYVVDCIDTLAPKLALISHSVRNGYKIVSSMGAGGKVNPSEVKITDIAQSYQCRLARYVRKRLHKEGIFSGVTVVFSPEEIDKERVRVTDGSRNKKSIIGTISYLPSIFGAFCASVVIRHLTNS